MVGKVVVEPYLIEFFFQCDNNRSPQKTFKLLSLKGFLGSNSVTQIQFLFLGFDFSSMEIIHYSLKL